MPRFRVVVEQTRVDFFAFQVEAEDPATAVRLLEQDRELAQGNPIKENPWIQKLVEGTYTFKVHKHPGRVSNG